jgi:uncharacterized coiled-coil DUF342 family protein
MACRLKAIRASALAKKPAVQELLKEVDRCWGELQAAKQLLLSTADERNSLRDQVGQLKAKLN